jgi:hypothetical protein
VIAAGAVPHDRPLLSELGQHIAAVRPLIKPSRQRKWSEARLLEIAQHYSDALADPTLNNAERRDHVARILGLERSDTTLRTVISELQAAGGIHTPTYELPVTTKRIRYRIRPGSNINRITFGADPVITVEPGHDYEATDWKTIRHIAGQPELEFDILEQTAR